MATQTKRLKNSIRVMGQTLKLVEKGRRYEQK
jgi:hypothetical protein